MDEATSLLFDLDGFQVVSVVEVDGGYRALRLERWGVGDDTLVGLGLM